MNHLYVKDIVECNVIGGVGGVVVGVGLLVELGLFNRHAQIMPVIAVNQGLHKLMWCVGVVWAGARVA